MENNGEELLKLVKENNQMLKILMLYINKENDIKDFLMNVVANLFNANCF